MRGGVSELRRRGRAFPKRCGSFEGRVRGMAWRIAEGDRDLMEDLVQEGLIGLWAAGEGGEGEGWEVVGAGVRSRMWNHLRWVGRGAGGVSNFLCKSR